MSYNGDLISELVTALEDQHAALGCSVYFDDKPMDLCRVCSLMSRAKKAVSGLCEGCGGPARPYSGDWSEMHCQCENDE